MAEVATLAKTSWLDNLGGFITSAGKIFTAGADVVVAANQRLAAIEASNEDTVVKKTTAAPKVVTGSPSTWPSWALPAGAAVGVLLLILLFRRTR